MPDSLSALVGAAGTQAPDAPKKKLKKVGDHFEDEQGNKFSDEAGTQPLNEGQQAKAGAPAKSAMDPFGVEKATGTGGWAGAQNVSGGAEKNKTLLEVPQGMTDAQKAEADTVWQQYSHAVGPQNEWYKKWMNMTVEDRKRWLDRVKNRSVM